MADGPSRQEVEAALAPLLARVGGEVVHGEPRSGDIPVPWHGITVLHVRLPGDVADPAAPGTDLSGGLARLITAVEEELGSPLASLPRPRKQLAVRMLEDRGAFEMRRGAETVAEALGLSRFTVYNYLNRTRDDGAAAAP
jgi:hypothetical protein